jgi:hypothetical protein
MITIGNRLRFICEDGAFTMTARIGDETQTFRADPEWLMEKLTALAERRLQVLDLLPEMRIGDIEEGQKL